MTAIAQSDWIVLTLVLISALVGPYAVALVRTRLSHSTPKKLYAPHLVFLCTVRFAPLLANGVPPASVTVWAFLEVLIIWAAGVSLSEWFLRQQLHRGA